MNLQEVLPQEGIEALAAQLGIAPEQAQLGAQALLPSIVGGMVDRAGGHGAPDAQGLESEVMALGGAQLADNVIGPEPTDVAKGNQMLGNIFGSKDVGRQVAGNASQQSGLDPALLKKMLPILAMLVAGYMSKRAGSQQGGLGGVLGSVLGGLTGGKAGGGAMGGGLGSILGSVLGIRR